MNRKQLTTTILTLCLITVMAIGQKSDSTSDLILKSYAARNYTSDPVSDKDLELILKCGIRSPSSRNMQPWKFIVVKETSLMKQVMGNATAGNALIIICGSESQDRSVVDFDCGLTTENMNIAAQSIGLGSRIYEGPVRSINSTLKQALKIPQGYRAVMVLRVGHIEKNVDAVSSASTRKSYDEVVTFLK